MNVIYIKIKYLRVCEYKKMNIKNPNEVILV